MLRRLVRGTLAAQEVAAVIYIRIDDLRDVVSNLGRSAKS
jgi:hypothetical protein